MVWLDAARRAARYVRCCVDRRREEKRRRRRRQAGSARTTVEVLDVGVEWLIPIAKRMSNKIHV